MWLHDGCMVVYTGGFKKSIDGTVVALWIDVVIGWYK